ncbi:MAG: SH3 domain-containing protein [Gammaproteobacteria bacterium]|nr:SH3 domain-containing protein [Gammaproteobacteria bacterium]
MVFSRLFRLLLLFLLATGAQAESLTLWVVQPFLELRTGPGEAYPRFYAVEQGQSLRLLRRKTSWFKVRAQGKEGWISQAQLEQLRFRDRSSLQLRPVAKADYLARRWELGFAGGLFSGDAVSMLRGGYRFNPNLLLEVGVSNVSGIFSSSNMYQLALVSRPMPSLTWAPYFSLGLGRFENRPRATLVDARNVDATAITAGIGLRRYITRRFLLRLDLKDYLLLVDDNQADEHTEWLLGVSAFF